VAGSGDRSQGLGSYEEDWGVRRRALGSIGMTTPDTRIVLRGLEVGEEGDPIVDHPGQPADSVHTDGTVWTWQAKRWRPLGGGRYLRVYDLVEPSIESN